MSAGSFNINFLLCFFSSDDLAGDNSRILVSCRGFHIYRIIIALCYPAIICNIDYYTKCHIGTNSTAAFSFLSFSISAFLTLKVRIRFLLTADIGLTVEIFESHLTGFVAQNNI